MGFDVGTGRVCMAGAWRCSRVEMLRKERRCVARGCEEDGWRPSDAALSEPGEPPLVTKGIRRDESRSPRMRSEGAALDVQYRGWPRNSTSSPKSS